MKVEKGGRVGVVMLVVTTVLVVVVGVEGGYDPFPKSTVVITNEVEGGNELMAHCKSKQDDLGVRMLKSGQSFDWSFLPHWFANTQFFCAFRWEQGGELHWFDVYKQYRDLNECQVCRWAIRRDGPCLATAGSEMCYKYNNPKFFFS